MFRSVHNVRIERLWVDVTAQVGAFWSDMFTELELHYGLDINNIHHIWLLQHLFLPLINGQLSFFAESWNQHRIQIRHGPNRSPADLFGFDMIVHGVRGGQLPLDDIAMTQEELEVYGVDWEGLHDERLLQAQRANNAAHEGWSSWVGRVGPPDNLNEVAVSPPSGPLSPQEIEALNLALNPWSQSPDDQDIIALWINGLGYAKAMYNHLL
jgi:hypothetical protein